MKNQEIVKIREAMERLNPALVQAAHGIAALGVAFGAAREEILRAKSRCSAARVK